MHTPPAAAITALLLCGGRATRMGGRDKGLLELAGEPLALHALRRLRTQSLPPAHIAISANRNLEQYAQLGCPVWPDTLPGFPGPLAGILTGMQRCSTPLLLVVPCDAPLFPHTLCARLLDAMQRSGAPLAVAATPGGVTQPVFCLVQRSLRNALAQHLSSDEHHGVRRWQQGCGAALAHFKSAIPFTGSNTPAELHAMQQRLVHLNS
ncbi:MAG: molybdenum cofactor guanylyltransferase [Ottowia sp.]|nr:molybdenum cofactor guanylyltransferase [Ottowia sp.]